MSPIFEGTIARRVLLNFRADPEVARRLVPQPLEIVTLNGCAVVGVCLIRLAQLRPQGWPAAAGISSENMAHRIAVRYPTSQGMKDGVFIWRRETAHWLASSLGGRVFPGVHSRAVFCVADQDGGLTLDVSTRNGEANVSLAARAGAWRPGPLFRTLDEVSGFFRRGDCGFSRARRPGRLEAMQLRMLQWEMTPLQVERVYAAFYQSGDRFPRGSIEFDSAVWMRGISHEWHALEGLEVGPR